MKLKKKFKIIIILLTLAFIFYIGYKENLFSNDSTPSKVIKKVTEEIDTRKQDYESCLNDTYLEENYSQVLLDKVTETNEKLANYKTYVSYSELDDNYYYGYKDSQVVYGASLIKLVDALYVIDNNIDINSTMKYTSNYNLGGKNGLSTRTVGEDITINDLVNYALSWSDNGAHQMLVSYIGFNNLKSYGNSLGAVNTLNGGDNFGFQSPSDTNIYLRRMYELYLTNDTAKSFVEYMKNDFHNYLKIGNIDAAHKYGFYSYNFHDIGIIFDTHPYVVSILTQYGNSDYETKIPEINLIVNDLHNTFWQEKDSYCYNLVYKK